MTKKDKHRPTSKENAQGDDLTPPQKEENVT